MQVLDNGHLRNATAAEIAEVNAREAAALNPIVPTRVPMLNAHLVLIGAGWFDGINAYIDALPDIVSEDSGLNRVRSKARAYFNLAQTMERNHPLVVGIPSALGKTDAEVDSLFIAAGKLNV